MARKETHREGRGKASNKYSYNFSELFGKSTEMDAVNDVKKKGGEGRASVHLREGFTSGTGLKTGAKEEHHSK